MPVYAVRLNQDTNFPLEAVGIFNASSLNDLRYLVDQAGPHRECDYRVMPMGGLIWSSRGPSFPMDMAEFSERFERAGCDERWQEALEDASCWKPLATSD